MRQNPLKLPYHYCPECGFTTPAKNAKQAELLTKGMRPEPGREIPQIPRRDDDIVLSPAAVLELAGDVLREVTKPAGPFDGLFACTTTLTKRKP